MDGNEDKKMSVEEFANILWENRDILKKMTRPKIDQLIDKLRAEEEKSGSVA